MFILPPSNNTRCHTASSPSRNYSTPIRPVHPAHFVLSRRRNYLLAIPNLFNMMAIPTVIRCNVAAATAQLALEPNPIPRLLPCSEIQSLSVNTKCKYPLLLLHQLPINVFLKIHVFLVDDQVVNGSFTTPKSVRQVPHEKLHKCVRWLRKACLAPALIGQRALGFRLCCRLFFRPFFFFLSAALS